MKFTKRIMCLVLTLLMVFSMAPLTAFATEISVSKGEDYTYYYDSNTLYVTAGYHITVYNDYYKVKSGSLFGGSVKLSLGEGSSVGNSTWHYEDGTLTVYSGTFKASVFSGFTPSKIVINGGTIEGGNYPNAQVILKGGSLTEGTYGTIYANSSDMVGSNVVYTRLILGYLERVEISGTYSAGNTVTATAYSNIGAIDSNKVTFRWWYYAVDFLGYWNATTISTSSSVTLPTAAVGQAIYLDVSYAGITINKDLGVLYIGGDVTAKIDYVNSKVVFYGSDDTMVAYKTDANANYTYIFDTVTISNGQASCNIVDSESTFLGTPINPGDTLYYAVAVQTGTDSIVGLPIYSYGQTKSIKIPERSAYSGPESVELTSTEDTVTVVDAPTDSSLQYLLVGQIDGSFQTIISQDGKFTNLTPGTTYYVYARTVSNNKLASSLTYLGEIATETPALAVVTVEQDAPLTYNGTPQGASVNVSVTEIEGKEITVTYSAVKDGTYGSMPKITDAGTYTFYYKASAEGYNDYIGEFTVTIDKAVVDAPTLDSKVYNGSTQTADVPASDLYTVTTNNGGTASGNYDVVLTLADSDNYKWASTEDTTITLPFAITKTDNSWTTTPAISGWTYGEKESTPAYGAKFGTVNVKYTGTANDGTAWDSSDVPTKAGEYKASFTVDATNDYGSLEKTVDFAIKKADYNMTEAKWNYTDAFAYDGLEKTVAVQGLPEGVTAEYEGNKATDTGAYTAKATLSYDSNNYNAPEIADLNWEIQNNWDPTEFVVTQLNENDYTNTDFTVVANDGYLLSLGNTNDSVWENMLTVTEETEDGSLTFYVRNDTTKAISLAKTVSFKIDKTAPTGKVYFDERNGWETFLNNITFGLFYKEEVIVKADSNDSLSGVETVEYLAGDKELTMEEAMESSDWKAMDENGVTVTFEDAKQFVYYVRITDKAGNVTYLSTNGAEYDNTTPVISGIENGKTYYTTQKVTVADKNIESITLNGEAVGEAITLDGNTEATYTIEATDKAGNTATVTVTMKPIADLSKAIDDVNTENVNSDNQQAINSVKDAVDAVDTENATDAEKEALNAIADKADELQKVIDDTIAEIQRITEELKKYSKDTVTSEDVTALEKLSNDIKALTDGGNLSAEEREALTKATEDIDELDKIVEDTVAKNTQIAEEIAKFNKDTVNSDDSEAMAQFLDSVNAQLASTNLTEEEKQTLEETKNAVAEMQKIVEDTVAKNTQIAEELAKFNKDTVNLDASEDMAQLLDSVNTQLASANLTEEEKQTLEETKNAVVEMQKIVEDTVAKNTQIAEELAKFNKDTVNSDDSEAMAQFLDSVNEQLTSTNLTEEEKQTLEETKNAVAEMQKIVEDTVAKNTQIAEELAKFNKDTVNSDDSEDMAQLLDSVNTQLDSANLTEEEKQTLEETKNAVAEMQKIVEDTVAKNTQIAEELAKFNKDTVNSDDHQSLFDFSNLVDTHLLSSNITEAEKQTLAETKDSVDEMLKIIDDTTTQIGNLTDNIGNFTENTVKASDKAALEQIIKDVDSLLNTTNLTEDEITAVENVKDQAEKLLNTVEVNSNADAFELLSVAQKKTTKNSITITWEQYKGAKKYIIYGAACGKKYKKIKTVTKTSFTNKGLKSGKYYKFYIVAVDSNGVELEKSNKIHISTSGNKNKANPTAITVNSNNVTIKVNKTFTVKANVKTAKDTAVKNHSNIKYVSTNKKVAKVSANGVITGKQSGSCYVYVYAQNGVAKKIKVTVK